MQFIRLPKAIEIAKRVLPELVSNWMNTNSVQNINIRFVEKMRVHILISWDIKQSKGGMPHRRTLRNVRWRAWAIWDLSNHDSFWQIPDQGLQLRIQMSVESISTIPFQAGTSYVNIPELGQQSSNRGMPYLISIVGTFWGSGDQPNENPGTLYRCPADVSTNITNHDIQWPGMLTAQKIGQVSHVRCINNWHNHRSGRKLI